MKTAAPYIGTFGVLAISLACSTHSDAVRTTAPAMPSPTADETVRAWPNAPDEYLSNEGLKRAWQNFEGTQQYRLAQPSDRNLTPAAAERVKTNSPHQIVPVINWWGARGYRGANTNDFLIAIVVDPSRSDSKRYGLLVIAAVASEGSTYKPYWVVARGRYGKLSSFTSKRQCFHRMLSPRRHRTNEGTCLGPQVSRVSLGIMTHRTNRV